MKWIDKIGKRIGKSASEGAIEIVKENADDILPAVLTLAGTIITIFSAVKGFKVKPKASHKMSSITISITNHYYGGKK